MKSVSLAGASGSIGLQALQVLRDSQDRFKLDAISVNSSLNCAEAIVREFDVSLVVVTGNIPKESRADFESKLPRHVNVEFGQDMLSVLPIQTDITLNAVVGFAGLRTTIDTLKAGKRLCLANKESLIAGGPVVKNYLDVPGAEIVPVDSEHAAIHQCLGDSPISNVRRIIITSSGGPFRTWTSEQLHRASVKDALAHPTWNMGKKISVDSSTLMNKGLEVIEAHELFNVSYDQIEVVIHPESVIHSMVEMVDGVTMAEMSDPDMCSPIAYALNYPDRFGPTYGQIDWRKLSSLSFEIPRSKEFRCLELAYEAGRCGGGAPAWLNAANEVAVAAFLDNSLVWTGISAVIEGTMERYNSCMPATVEEIEDHDCQARSVAADIIKNRYS